MSRRKESTGDSLELLLDTICNMFGGIVFISLLVVVMLQTTAKPAPDVSPVEAIDPADLEILEGDLAKLRLERDRLAQARAAQVELIARLIPEDYDQKLADLRELAREQAELEQKAQSLGESNLDRTRQVSEEQRSLAADERKLEEARRELKSLEAEHEELLKRKTETLPVAEFRPGLTQVQVSICYDRLYIRHEWVGGERAGPNLDDYFVSESDGESIRVHPKPTGGIPLDGSERSNSLIAARLRSFSPDEHQIAVTVWPDSYDSFRTLRALLAEAGFRYQILACRSTDSVVDRGGRDRPSQ